MSNYQREWRRRRARERIKKKQTKYIEDYKKQKIRSQNRRTEKSAYIAGIIDGEGSIYLGIQKKRLFIPAISISNNDEKMLQFCKETLRFGYISKRKCNISKNRPNHSWVHFIGKREDIVRVLIQVRPFLITKQKQADLLFEYCVNRLEIRQPYTERDYEIYRELRILNKRNQGANLLSITQLKNQIHYSSQKFRG